MQSETSELVKAIVESTKRVGPLITAKLQRDAQRLEATVTQYVTARLPAAHALAEIYDRKYMWDEFPNFSSYCATKWNISPTHAYRMVEIGNLLNRLLLKFSHAWEKLPTTQGQCIELLKIPVERQVEAWVAVRNKRPEGTVAGEELRTSLRSFARNEGVKIAGRKKRQPKLPLRATSLLQELIAKIGEDRTVSALEILGSPHPDWRAFSALFK